MPLSSCFLHTGLYTYYLLHACLVASVVSDSVTLWTVGCQAPLSMGFSRQEYWSGLPFIPPGDLRHPETEPVSLAFPALAGGFFITAPTGKSQISLAAAAKSLQSCPTLCDPTRVPCPWDSPGKNTGVGCHCLLRADKPYCSLKSQKTVQFIYSKN